MSRATMASTSPSLRAPLAGRRSPRRCRLAPTCSIISFSSSARGARAPMSPPRPRRSFSSCSRMTRRRRRSFALPPRSAPPRSTSSTARRLRAPMAIRRRTCRNRHKRRRRCERSSSPRWTSQTSAATRAELIDALLASSKDAGSRSPWPRRWPERRRIGARSRRAQTSPRPAFGSRLSPAKIKLPGPGRIRGDRVQSWQFLLVTTDPLSARARAALASGVDIALKARIARTGAATARHRARCAWRRGADPALGARRQSPQPHDGYLPETGVLCALKEAADRGEVGPTVLFAAAAFGPDGPQDAHLIALGDGLRALKRVGLDAEARRLAFEALVHALASARKGVKAGAPQKADRATGRHGPHALPRHADGRARRRRKDHRGLHSRPLRLSCLPRAQAQDRARRYRRDRCAPISPSCRAKASRRPRARGSSPPCASFSASCSAKVCARTIPVRPSTVRSSAVLCRSCCRWPKLRALLAAAADGVEQAGEGSASRRALRMHALIETLYATGLRVSELLGLAAPRAHHDDRVLTIKGKGGRERLVPLNDSARQAACRSSRCDRRRRSQGQARFAVAVSLRKRRRSV